MVIIIFILLLVKVMVAVTEKGKGDFYLTSVLPSVPTRLLSMETDGATISAPFYGYSKL